MGIVIDLYLEIDVIADQFKGNVYTAGAGYKPVIFARTLRFDKQGFWQRRIYQYFDKLNKSSGVGGSCGSMHPERKHYSAHFPVVAQADCHTLRVSEVLIFVDQIAGVVYEHFFQFAILGNKVQHPITGVLLTYPCSKAHDFISCF